MNEKVSVIVPIYKVEKYLDRCVESVVNQTYKNLEIILVDDGSPDNCPQMCDAWAQKDARIKVIHKENAGIGMARNSGLEIATGEYLMFVDSDDYLSENAVEVLYKRIIEDGSDLAIGKHVDVYDDGTANDSFCRWMNNEVITRDRMLFQMGEEQRFSVMACMKMYKREVFKELKFPKLTCGEDCCLFSSIVENCERISVVDQLVYFYYQRADSILHQMTDVRRLDDIAANLELTRYLFEKGQLKAAAKWYGISVDKATSLKNKAPAKKMFKTRFAASERKKLLKKAGKKVCAKWICLFVPFVFPLAKRISCKMRGSKT